MTDPEHAIPGTELPVSNGEASLATALAIGFEERVTDPDTHEPVLRVEIATGMHPDAVLDALLGKKQLTTDILTDESGRSFQVEELRRPVEPTTEALIGHFALRTDVPDERRVIDQMRGRIPFMWFRNFVKGDDSVVQMHRTFSFPDTRSLGGAPETTDSSFRGQR